MNLKNPVVRWIQKIGMVIWGITTAILLFICVIAFWMVHWGIGLLITLFLLGMLSVTCADKIDEWLEKRKAGGGSK